MTDDNLNETSSIERGTVGDVAAEEHASTDETTHPATARGEEPQYGVGPFSIREVVLVGVWLIAFIVSFFSVASQQVMGQLLSGGSVWTNGLDWILTIGVPTVAVFLVVLRRFSPDGIRRVGSLGVDQFASVAFSVSAVVWLTLLWRSVAFAIESNVWIYGWVVWLEFFLMLTGVVLTVFAPVIRGLSDDFTGRHEVVAHRSARPIRPVSPRPVSRRPGSVNVEREPRDDAAPAAGHGDATAGYGADASPAGAYGSDAYRTDAYGALDTWAAIGTDDVVEEQPVTEARHQAFWALVPEERDIVDERAVPIFRIGPSAWALVLEDRGEVFVVRHEDGRIGYLHDISGVTRG